MTEKENSKYRILVIGLGSMGKRRIRNLQSLGFTNIFGFDTRIDRQNEVKSTYNISIVEKLDQEIEDKNINIFIISVPPDQHASYILKAIEKNIHFFVEASVVDEKMDLIVEKLKTKNIVGAPSSTLYFHPAIKLISEILKNKELGKISNVIYHSGQYLPDWHNYEHVSEYYVSKKETGGAREILPFELTWITKALGFPNKVTGVYKKTIDIEGAEKIDDTYNALLIYDQFIVNIVIDVVSRFATRKLLINGSKRQLIWNWDDNMVKIFNPESNSWKNITYEVKSSAQGYNKNITEQMYVDELKNFFEAIENKNSFFNTMEYDHQILQLLYCIEKSYDTGMFQTFKI